MKLADWRKERGLSQRDVGDAIGVNQSHIARFESGKLIPNRWQMPALFALTNGMVAPNDFFPLHKPPVDRGVSGCSATE